MEELKTYRLADICNSIQTGPFGSQLHKSDYVEFGTPYSYAQRYYKWQNQR